MRAALLSAWNISFFGAVGLLVALAILISPNPYLRISILRSRRPHRHLLRYPHPRSSSPSSSGSSRASGSDLPEQGLSIASRPIYVESNPRHTPSRPAFLYLLRPRPSSQAPGTSGRHSCHVDLLWRLHGRDFPRRNPGHTPRDRWKRRSPLGMSRATAMRRIIIPQTVRDHSSAHRERVHRSFKGFVACIHSRRIRSSAPRPRIRVDIFQIFRKLYGHRSHLSRDDALFLAPCRDDGRKAEASWKRTLR